MFDRSEILKKAWKDYHRDVKKGWGQPTRARFAYCLKMAWAVAKDVASRAAASAARVHDEAAATVFAFLKGNASEADASAAQARASRAEEIQAELHDMQFADFINWARHSALRAELAQLYR